MHSSTKDKINNVRDNTDEKLMFFIQQKQNISLLELSY